MPVAPWVKTIVESVMPNTLRIGGYYVINGRPAKIISGRYWGDHGVSNFWEWQYVLSSGKLGKKDSGYGGRWKEITQKEAQELARK